MLKSNIDKATSFEKRFENAGTVVYEDSEAASKAVAEEMAALIRVKPVINTWGRLFSMVKMNLEIVDTLLRDPH